MTKDQKIDFIHDLVNAVRKRIIDRVNEMPEEWDGHELRRYIADQFADRAYGKSGRAGLQASAFATIRTKLS